MSERTDKKNELLKSNLQDSSKVYNLEPITNDQNDILKYLLNQSINYCEIPIVNTTDWNNLATNNAYLIQSFNGKHAPLASKFPSNNGFVLVIGDYEIVLSDDGIALRTINSAWHYLGVSSVDTKQMIENYITHNITPIIQSNVNKLGNLATTVNSNKTSLASQANSLAMDLNNISVNSGAIKQAEQFIKNNGASIDNVNRFAESNKGTITSLANVDSNLQSSINSLGSNKADKSSMSASFSSEDNNVRQVSSNASASNSATNNTIHNLTFGDIKPSDETNETENPSFY